MKQLAIMLGLTLAAIAFGGGCTQATQGRPTKLNGKLPDPSPDFMKKVERDSFPRAGSLPQSSSAKAKTP